MTLTALTGGAVDIVANLITDPHLAMLHVANEATTSALRDLGINGIDGTIVGAPTQGVALGSGFTGITLAAASSQYITLSSSTALQLGDATAHGIVIVTTFNNTAAVKALLSMLSTDGANGWEAYLDASENLCYAYNSGAGVDLVTSNSPLTTSSLQIIGISKTGAGAAAISMYVAGSVIADTDTTNTASGDATYTSVSGRIGATRSGTTSPYDGGIGLVALISGRAPSAYDHMRWADLARLR